MGMVQSSGSKLFMVRRTTGRTCAAFRPEVDFDDEGQGGISFSSACARWAPTRLATAARFDQAPVMAIASPSGFAQPVPLSGPGSAAPRAGLGPTRHERTGAIRKGWFARRKTISKRCQAQGRGRAHGHRLAAIIVQASRAQYHAGGRPCACPDDTMRNGRACGGRSAYSRPGGASPGRQRAA